MKKFFLIVAALLNFVIAGCASQTAVLNEEYSGLKITNINLAVVKLFDKPLIFNADDVVDDLGEGVPDEVYASFFDENFIKNFMRNDSFKKVRYEDKSLIPDLKEKTLDINDKEKMKILLPEENQIIDIHPVQSDFILFIDKLQTSRIQGVSGPGYYSPPGLFQQLYFALWDNTKGRLVSYGRIEEQTSFVFAMTKEIWESGVKGVTEQILQHSPFPVKEYFRQ